jgi:hypothetical protein
MGHMFEYLHVVRSVGHDYFLSCLFSLVEGAEHIFLPGQRKPYQRASSAVLNKLARNEQLHSKADWYSNYREDTVTRSTHNMRAHARGGRGKDQVQFIGIGVVNTYVGADPHQRSQPQGRSIAMLMLKQ